METGEDVGEYIPRYGKDGLTRHLNRSHDGGRVGGKEGDMEATACAWCKRLMSGTLVVGQPVKNHGICKECSDLLLKEARPAGHSHTKSLTESPVDEST